MILTWIDYYKDDKKVMIFYSHNSCYINDWESYCNKDLLLYMYVWIINRTNVVLRILFLFHDV